MQLKVLASGVPPVAPPSDDELRAQYAGMLTSPDYGVYAYDGSCEWGGIVRKLNRELPGYAQ